MTIAEGRKPRTSVSAEKVRAFVATVDGDVTTGDVARKFNVSRAQARDRLMSLADEGLLRREGNGGGAKYRRVNGDGPGPIESALTRAAQRRNDTKPVLPAEPAELRGLLDKLSSDCDRELSRLDDELEAAEEALRAAEERYTSLTRERAKVERAKIAMLAD